MIKNALLLSKFKYNESLIDSLFFEKKSYQVSEVIDDKIFQLLIKNSLIKDYLQYFINKNSIQRFKKFLICLSVKYEENKLQDLEMYLNKKVGIDEYEILLISLYKSLNSVKSIQNKIKGLKNLSFL